MSRVVSVHSFRGGTGKSNTTANLATLLALEGRRVGVVDTDIQSPGIHILFGLGEEEIVHSLNDYLWGKCEIAEAAHDVTARLETPMPGRVFLIPSSIKAGEIARVLKEGYDVGLLSEGFQRLTEELKLDVLLIDTHPGLNEETLLSISISDVLLIILRADHQDYQGTGVTIEVARRLNVPCMMLVVNKVPPSWVDRVRQQVQETYGCEVVAVLPHSDDMMMLASAGIFSIRFPDSPLTQTYRQIAMRLSQ